MSLKKGYKLVECLEWLSSISQIELYNNPIPFLLHYNAPYMMAL